MDELRSLREQAEIQYSIETKLLQDMSISESLRIWVMLQKAFEGQLKQTAELFENGHRESLIELQARLDKLMRQAA